MSLTSAVVGLGRVGIGYDINLSKQQFVLSHARSLEVCPETKLIAGVDNSDDRINQFKEIYKVPAFKSISDFLGDVRPDLIVISTPTLTLTDIANEILDTYMPSGILIEKPISQNLDSVINLVERCEDSGTKLFVNYTRRSSPVFKEIRNRIFDGTFQGPFIGSAWYTNGILNNGSHLLNILEYFFGDVQTYSQVRKIADRENDCDLQVTVTFRDCEVVLRPLPIENFSQFKIELFGVNGVLTLETGFKGFTWTNAQNDEVFPELKTLSGRTNQFGSDMQFSQLHVINSVEKAIRGLGEDACTGRQGLSTLRNLIGMIGSVNV